MLSTYIAHKNIVAYGREVYSSSLCSHIEESMQNDNFFSMAWRVFLNFSEVTDVSLYIWKYKFTPTINCCKSISLHIYVIYIWKDKPQWMTYFKRKVVFHITTETVVDTIVFSAFISSGRKHYLID